MGLTLRGCTLEISDNFVWSMVASCICKGIKHHKIEMCAVRQPLCTAQQMYTPANGHSWPPSLVVHEIENLYKCSQR